jgi:hypothetical protein
MGFVPNRVTGISEADHLVNAPVLIGEPHIGEPRGEISRSLTTEAVLRCDHERGIVAGVFERANERVRDDEMAALREGRTRRDDRYARHRAARREKEDVISGRPSRRRR